MPELKRKEQPSWTLSTEDLAKIPYANKEKEKKRKQLQHDEPEITKPKRTASKGVAWSQKKEAAERRKERKRKREVRREAKELATMKRTRAETGQHPEV